MNISIIVAIADNGVIGKDNQLPWRLPADLRHFKSVTMGHPVIMGRKTYESLGKPLPGRTNIVVTRQCELKDEGWLFASSLNDALLISNTRLACDQDEIMIIGGAQLYSEALTLAQRLYITEVHGLFEGDTYFPEYDHSAWQEKERNDYSADEKNNHAYSFTLLARLS